MSGAVSLLIAALMLISNFIVIMHIFPSKIDLRISIGLVAFFFTCQLVIILIFGPREFKLGGLRGLFYFPLFVVLFKGKVFQKLFVFSLQIVLTVSTALLVGETARFFFNEESLRYNIFRLSMIIPVYIVYVVTVIKKLPVIYEKLFAYGTTKEWALYSFAGMAAFVMMTITRMAADRPVSIVILFFILLSFAVLIFAIVNTHEKTKQKIESDFAKRIISSGQGHYQKMNEMYDKLRMLRHDYKYHLNALREMLRFGNTFDVAQYLTHIEDQLSKHEIPKYCANAVLNALISSYAERCMELHITFTIHINIPESLGVPDYDMCIVLGNLLENAVEGAAEAGTKLEHSENAHPRFIELETHIKSAQFLVMVKNSFNGVIHNENGVLISSKTNRGFGLKSVKEVIARHGGDLLTEWNEDTFTVYAAITM